jgi:diguanylate cyclase (GGDEF)-like protein
MRDEVIIDILNRCLAADSKAVLIYSHFAGASKKKSLKDFWTRMSAVEEKHTSYWRELLKLAREDMLPQLFEQPYKVKEELDKVQAKVEELLQESEKITNPADMFLLAFRIEFHILQPALVSFLNFLETLPNQESPLEDYKAHLMEFVAALNEYGADKPELKLLGETVERLWRDNSRLAMMSNTDPLTGIYNRRGMLDALIPLVYLAHRKKLAVGVLIVDIDDFKKVNDRHGHRAGDEVLAWVAETLKSNIRVSDVIGRYGGEEFLVYLSDVNTEFIFKIAEKLRRLIESGSRQRIPVTISIGGAGGMVQKDIEDDLQALISKADANLYKAKAAGKNKVAINGKLTKV